MSSYEVDPDALFSDEEEPPQPSPKRARPDPVPRAPQAPSLGHLSLPSYGRANLSGRKPYVPLNPPRVPHPPPSYQPRPPPRYHPPPHIPPRNDPVRYDAPRGPMGRGRGATLPAHVTQRERTAPVRQAEKPRPALPPGAKGEILAAASILPEEDRERFIQDELRKRQAAAAATERKRPSRRRRMDDNATQKVLTNVKSARRGTFKGLNSLLQAAQNSGQGGLIPSEAKPAPPRKAQRQVSEHSVYAEVTMTKEMQAREERDRIAKQRRLEEERRQTHEHFREQRMEERETRIRLSKAWAAEETVAAGMRHAYRLARVERTLFGEEEDRKKRDTLEYLGLLLRPLEDDKRVMELMTIEVEEI